MSNVPKNTDNFPLLGKVERSKEERDMKKEFLREQEKERKKRNEVESVKSTQQIRLKKREKN